MSIPLWTSGLLGLVIALVYFSLTRPTPELPEFSTTTMATATLKFITLPALRKHTATVVFLHVRTASPGQQDLAACRLIVHNQIRA
jgi:hypothetical protein